MFLEPGTSSHLHSLKTAIGTLPRIIIVVDEHRKPFNTGLPSAGLACSVTGATPTACAFGNRTVKHAPRTFALACGSNTTAVRLDQVTHNGKAQPESAVAARGGPIDLVEPIEDGRLADAQPAGCHRVLHAPER